ncbi:response regulator transcription factor [Clostridiaceae bacterium M8S5]|nr:response regulator transcription factor [Clostridiaceae bacterium M8S5]
MIDNLKILVVDDEIEITDLVAIHLSNDYDVIKCYDSTRVMDIINIENISLVILDIMMPNIDGLALCKMIREKYNIPIIMLSAKSMDMDKVIGLTYGADDYITKPFNPIELVARVKAQLRRFIKLNQNIKDCTNLIELNGLAVNKESHTVTLYDRNIELTKREFDILYLLMLKPNKVYSSEEIFEKVWKEKYYEASNNTVMVHIRHLRKKLGDKSRKPKFIKTVWGVGYKIVR